jgi:hypothetical protein
VVRQALEVGTSLADLTTIIKVKVIRIPVDHENGSLQRAARRLGVTNRAGRANRPFSALDQLRLLLVPLADNWWFYRVFDWQAGVPWSNNLTEQAIGRMKMWARTVQGYKSSSRMLNGLFVADMGLA